jgi:hypothetical protein
MKMPVFWDAVLYSLVETNRRFRGACHLHHQAPVERRSISTKLHGVACIRAMMMETVSTSETSVNFNETIRRNLHHQGDDDGGSNHL